MKKLLNTNFLNSMKTGSKIHIKKSHEGKFTDYCGGNVTSECIAKGKASSDPAIRKRATFAANARKWKHEHGGVIKASLGLKMTDWFGKSDSNGITNAEKVNTGIKEGTAAINAGINGYQELLEKNKQDAAEVKKEDLNRLELAKLKQLKESASTPGERMNIENKIEETQNNLILMHLDKKEEEQKETLNNISNGITELGNVATQTISNFSDPFKDLTGEALSKSIQDNLSAFSALPEEKRQEYLNVIKTSIPMKDLGGLTSELVAPIINTKFNIPKLEINKHGGIFKPSRSSKLKYLNSLK